MKKSDEKRWFKTMLDIIHEHRACVLASVNVEEVVQPSAGQIIDRGIAGNV